MILGLIVEKVTHRSLGLELTNRIFKPFGLHGTSFPTTPRIVGPHAHGYYVLGQPPPIDVTGLTPLPWAAGAIVSTAPDIATFYRALLSDRLLPHRLLREMVTTVQEGSQVDIAGQRAGLGLQRFPTGCGAAWGHDGSFPGYVVYAFSSRNGHRQAVLMLNEDASSLPKPVAALLFRLLSRAYCTTA